MPLGSLGKSKTDELYFHRDNRLSNTRSRVLIQGDTMNLTILSAISVVGIMIAINAQGKARMAITWLLATFLLIGNGIMVGSYLKERNGARDEAIYSERLASEKDNIAKSLEVSQTGKANLQGEELKSSEYFALIELISAGEKLAETLAAKNLDDYTQSEEERISQAASLKRDTQELKARFSVLKPKLVFYRENSLAQAIDKLDKSALNCKMFYSSTDSDQESVREKVMRTSAIASKELFLKSKRAVEAMK